MKPEIVCPDARIITPAPEAIPHELASSFPASADFGSTTSGSFDIGGTYALTPLTNMEYGFFF